MKLKSFMILVLLCLAAQALEAQNHYLVSVGIGDYPGEESDLRTFASDAKGIARLYRKNNNAKVVLLTNSNAASTRIKAAAEGLFKKAERDDIVVLFFSGHGYPGGFATYDDYLSYSEVLGLFDDCKAKNKMVFAEACYSGDMRGDNRIGHVNPRNNVMMFLSSRPDEYSYERSDMRNGIFVSCLIRALKGGADKNGDRIITARELFDSVSMNVKELSKDKQHPVMWGNFGDSMPVMIW